jgi:AbrB family looped-hinge helix DNA binding protein
VSTVTVSSKGQIVLPVALRRRLSLGPGAKLEMSETADGLTLKVVKDARIADPAAYAGMLKAPTRGVARRLSDFDAASILNGKASFDT